MILSNYTATTSLSRNTDPLPDCYQKLSLLMNVANKVRDYHISQFGGATLQRSRLHYTEDSVNATKVREFVEAWIERTARDGLWEYKKPLQAKKGRPKKSNRAEEKSTEKKVKIGKKAAAEKKAQHVFNVPLIDMRGKRTLEPLSRQVSQHSKTLPLAKISLLTSCFPFGRTMHLTIELFCGCSLTPQTQMTPRTTCVF